MPPTICWTSSDLAAQLAKDVADKQHYVLAIDGFTGVGKTHLAKELARVLNIKHVELDSYSSKRYQEYVLNMNLERIKYDTTGHSVVADGIHILEIAKLIHRPIFRHMAYPFE